MAIQSSILDQKWVIVIEATGDVDTFDEAFSWFEEMANKSRAPHNSN